MISGVMVCDNTVKGKSCGGTMFIEEYATQVVRPSELETPCESGKLRQNIATGRYSYRCLECGKRYSFQATESDLFDGLR